MTFKEGIQKLRSYYPVATIEVKAISLDETKCVSEAVIKNADKVLAQASSIRIRKENDKNDKYVNDCEEAAILRAIKYIHFPEKCVAAEPTAAEPMAAELKMKFIKYIERHKLDEEKRKKICTRYKIDTLQDMTEEMCKHYIKVLEENGGNIDE